MLWRTCVRYIILPVCSNRLLYCEIGHWYSLLNHALIQVCATSIATFRRARLTLQPPSRQQFVPSETQRNLGPFLSLKLQLGHLERLQPLGSLSIYNTIRVSRTKNIRTERLMAHVVRQVRTITFVAYGTASRTDISYYDIGHQINSDMESCSLLSNANMSNIERPPFQTASNRAQRITLKDYTSSSSPASSKPSLLRSPSLQDACSSWQENVSNHSVQI